MTCVYRQFGGGEGGRECQQGEWYVFDPRLVLPEYLVTVSYLPVEQEEETDIAADDEDIISSSPSPTQRPK